MVLKFPSSSTYHLPPSSPPCTPPLSHLRLSSPPPSSSSFTSTSAPSSPSSLSSTLLPPPLPPSPPSSYLAPPLFHLHSTFSLLSPSPPSSSLLLRLCPLDLHLLPPSPRLHFIYSFLSFLHSPPSTSASISAVLLPPTSSSSSSLHLPPLSTSALILPSLAALPSPPASSTGFNSTPPHLLLPLFPPISSIHLRLHLHYHPTSHLLIFVSAPPSPSSLHVCPHTPFLPLPRPLPPSKGTVEMEVHEVRSREKMEVKEDVEET